MPGAVAMTVSANRPAYLKETLESWLQVRGLERWWFGFMMEPGRHAEECRDLIGRWVAVAPCVSSSLTENAIRRGVLHNPYASMTWACDMAASFATPFAVLAEEDALVSTDVLEYFETLAEQHRSDENVLGVCAFTPEEGGDPLSYGPGGFSPLVWGTWPDRWSRLLAPQWFTAAADGPAPGTEEGWDWGVTRLARANGVHFLVPGQSRSQHIGEFGGVHMLPEDFAASRAPSFVTDRPPWPGQVVAG